jgi:hypothetical protein
MANIILRSSTTMTAPNTSDMHDVWATQFWGPVTATLDWCEVNIMISGGASSTRG